MIWTQPKRIGPVQKNWTRPKRIGPVPNGWYSTKMIQTVQNHFGPIEGQGITVLIYILCCQVDKGIELPSLDVCIQRLPAQYWTCHSVHQIPTQVMLYKSYYCVKVLSSDKSYLLFSLADISYQLTYVRNAILQGRAFAFIQAKLPQL